MASVESKHDGVPCVLRRIPQGARVYISIDIDGLDPSIAPGTGTPSHGGFIYYEVKDWMAFFTNW